MDVPAASAFDAAAETTGDVPIDVIATAGSRVSIRVDAPLERAIETFHAHPALRLLPVIDGADRPVGALFETDIRTLLFNPFGHALLKNPHYGQRLDRHLRACPVAEETMEIGALLDFYASSGATEGLILVRDGRFRALLPNRILIALAVRREAARHARIRAASDRFRADARRLAHSLADASAAMLDQASGMVLRGEATRARSAAMAETTREMLDGVSGVAARGHDLVGAIETIQGQTAQARGATADAVGRVEQDVGRVRALADAAAEIGSVTGMIGGIADRVKLLSINAAIEAARVGSTGNGFGVIAQEIKALAVQTRTAAGSIAARVGGVGAVVEDVAARYADLAAVIASVDASTVSIDHAIGDQRIATQDIAGSTQQAAHAGRGILADIADMTARADAAVARSGAIKHLAEALAADTGALRRHVDGFLAEVAA